MCLILCNFITCVPSCNYCHIQHTQLLHHYRTPSFCPFIHLFQVSPSGMTLVHQPGINPYHPHRPRGVITTGPPGKSLHCRFITKAPLCMPPPSPYPYKTFKNKENISLGEIAISIFLSIITGSLQLSNFY